MLRIFKIGTKWPGDPYRGWRDGQLVDMHPSGTYMSPQMRKHFLIIEDGLDYWAVRGSTNWKSTNAKVMDFKKLLSTTDSNGRYRWEPGFLEDEKPTRIRDYFIDPKALLDSSQITQGQFDTVYDKKTESGIITLSGDPANWLFHEDVKAREPSIYSSRVGSISQDCKSGEP